MNFECVWWKKLIKNKVQLGEEKVKESESNQLEEVKILHIYLSVNKKRIRECILCTEYTIKSKSEFLQPEGSAHYKRP